MKLTIVGLPQAHMAEVERACVFFAQKLMSSRLLKTLDVTIHFKHLRDMKGEVRWCDKNHAPKVFEMKINFSNLREVLKTIAHEFVHIKQYASGDMKDLQNGAVAYKKEWYNMPDDDNEDYWFYPWEVEAHGMEVGLYNIYATRFHGGVVPYVSVAK